MDELGSAGRRPFPWVGLGVVIAIVLAIVAFGLSTRKGGRKPPPIPDETSERYRPARTLYS